MREGGREGLRGRGRAGGREGRTEGGEGEGGREKERPEKVHALPCTRKLLSFPWLSRNLLVSGLAGSLGRPGCGGQNVATPAGSRVSKKRMGSLFILLFSCSQYIQTCVYIYTGFDLFTYFAIKNQF